MVASLCVAPLARAHERRAHFKPLCEDLRRQRSDRSLHRLWAHARRDRQLGQTRRASTQSHHGGAPRAARTLAVSWGMSRELGLAVVIVLLAVAAVGVARPDIFPGDVDIPQLVYLLMALLLVSGAGYGFWRFRDDGGRALGGIVFWAVLIVAITLIYPLVR